MQFFHGQVWERIVLDQNQSSRGAKSMNKVQIISTNMGIISKLIIILLCFYKSQQFKKPGGYQNLEILLDEFDIDNPYIVKSHKMEEAQYAKIRKKCNQYN